MAAKVTRATSSRVLALTNSEQLLEYATALLPMGLSNNEKGGFDAEGRATLKAVHDADAQLRRKLTPESNETMLLVPVSARLDHAAMILRRQYGNIRLEQQLPPPPLLRQAVTIHWLRDCSQVLVVVADQLVLRVRTTPGAYADIPCEEVQERLQHVNAVAAALKYVGTWLGNFARMRPVVVFGTMWEQRAVRQTGTFLELWQEFGNWQWGEVFFCVKEAPIFQWVNAAAEKSTCASIFARPFLEVADRENSIKWPKRTGYEVFYNPFTDTTSRILPHRRAKIAKCFREALKALGLEKPTTEATEDAQEKQEDAAKTVDDSQVSCLPETVANKNADDRRHEEENDEYEHPETGAKKGNTGSGE
eukprot:g15528.t1